MKKSIKILTAVVCVVLAIMLLCLYFFQHKKDVKDIDKLTLAPIIENECKDIHISLLDENVDENTKELSVVVDNQSDYRFFLSPNEIVLDRFIDGQWYYWGTCGNGYEMTMTSYPGEKMEFTYHLSADVLTSADYVEQYNKICYTQNGSRGRWIAYPRVQLFSGTYRIRMKGALMDDSMRDETLDCQMVFEFDVK